MSGGFPLFSELKLLISGILLSNSGVPLLETFSSLHALVNREQIIQHKPVMFQIQQWSCNSDKKLFCVHCLVDSLQGWTQRLFSRGHSVRVISEKNLFSSHCLLVRNRLFFVLYWAEREISFLHENYMFKRKKNVHRHSPIASQQSPAC